MILVLTLVVMLVGGASAVPALANHGPGEPPACDWDYSRDFWEEYRNPAVWGYVCEDEEGDLQLVGLWVDGAGWVWWDEFGPWWD